MTVTGWFFLINTLYAGRHCHLLELTSQHIKDLYPLVEVVEVLTVYRPWYKPEEHAISNVVERSEWLTTLVPRPEIEALIVTASNFKPVGFICLGCIDSTNLKAELSIGMFHYRGTRVTLEALHWVLETVFAQLHKVVFCVAPSNTQAVQLLKSLDIPLEAVLRKEMLAADGNRQDLWRYALLASEWRTGHARQRLQRLVPLGPAITHSPSP